MLFPQLTIRLYTLTIVFFAFSHLFLHAQSVLLIESNTIVYDSYNDTKVVKVKIDEDTWVNYKGRFGNYFKISNFFGKDEYYPIGVFEGYVSITSVLDTASRKEYKDLVTSDQAIAYSRSEPPVNSGKNEITFVNTPETSIASTPVYDVDKYYLGMSRTDALSVQKSSIRLGKSSYKIEFNFSQRNLLSELKLSGGLEDALAVDESVKSQINELEVILSNKYGDSFRSFGYPSFLEIGENEIFEVARWTPPNKTISLGVGEKDDLYFSSLIIKVKK